MRIYTSYYARENKLRSSHLIPIGISRVKPEWFKGPNLIELAPKPFMKGLPYEQYKEHYLKILREMNWSYLFKKIQRIDQGQEVVFCCYESLKDESEFCHRTILAEYLNKKFKGRLQVEEFEPHPRNKKEIVINGPDLFSQ